MGNILQKIEEQDIVFFKEFQYSPEKKTEYLKIFADLKKAGTIHSDFLDDTWKAFTGVHGIVIDFYFDEAAYRTHLYKYLHINETIIKDMCKCYAIFLSGTFIHSSIRARIKTLKSFLTNFGEKNYHVNEWGLTVIVSFLEYIGTTEKDIEYLCGKIHISVQRQAGQRKLAHLINYLAIANEVKSLYSCEISDADFLRWFPIFFWASITFIIPLRATELLLTPKECITEKDGKYYINLRRTILKKGTRTVYYSVDKDYKIFSYPVPKTDAIQNILRYQSMTANIHTKYLFVPSEKAHYGTMQLQSLNLLLEEFICTYLIGNRKYDYARYASGIKEFQIVTAGDSRPIAIANLYYQDVSLDLCRQLSNHEKLNTTYGYASNVSETIYASSIIDLQNKINNDRDYLEALEKMKDVPNSSKPTWVDKEGCASPCRPHYTGNISDCLKSDHLYECLGCKYYYPTNDQLDAEINERRKKLEIISRQAVDCLNNIDQAPQKNVDIDKILLTAHTDTVRYKDVCDAKAKEEARNWARHRPITKI